jgi:hypothetical protein
MAILKKIEKIDVLTMREKWMDKKQSYTLKYNFKKTSQKIIKRNCYESKEEEK